MSGGSAGAAGGSAGVPQIEFPGGFPGAGGDQEGGADGECGEGAGEVGSTEGCGSGADGEAAKTGSGGQGQNEGDGTGEGDAAGGVGATGDPAEDSEAGAGGVAQYPVESEEERRRRLEGVLDESIGGFDEVIMEEQQEIAKVSRNTEGFGQGGTGGEGGGVGLGSQGGGGGSSGNVQVSNRAEERKSSVDDLSEAERQARTPDDIVLVDEDIVARQLREAALAEEDPELRERLWEEYRKYTRQ